MTQLQASSDLPSQMTFMDVASPGAPDVLKPAVGPLPAIRPGDVLIRVLAAGVNRPDVVQRQGHYPPPPDASPIIGLEVAGEIVAIGRNVTTRHIGEKVTALANGGGYAEFCAVPATQCLPWPKGFDAIQAAALPETYFTVWANLFAAGRLKSGEDTLIHGGTSGIGVTAIKLARAFGARVFATAGSEEKCRAAVEFGATAAINYRTQDFVAEIQKLTDKRGVDVVLDMVGAPYFPRNLRVLAMDGRLLLIAFLGGSVVENVDLMPIMRRRLVVTGSTMRPRSSAEKGKIANALYENVWPLMDRGQCLPVIHRVFPLREAAEAHRLMESSSHIGKIVLRVA